MTGGLVEIPVPAGTAEAWLSRPSDDGPHPGVVLFMDAFGIRPRIEEMAERIAGWGHVVLAPNVFHRNGSVADLAPKVDLRSEEAGEFTAGAFGRVRALTADLAEQDVPAYVDALLALPGVSRPIGVTGYCMGARLAVRTAGQFPGTVAAVGGFHGGGLATDAPDSPHLAIAASTAEYAFGHADQDRSMPLEQVEALEQALQAAGRPHLNEVYAGAAHGYTMADTSMYDAAGAERHFSVLQGLLARTL